MEPPAALGVSTYIEKRLEQYAGWYDAKASATKRSYLRTRVTAAVASVLTPVVANWTFEFSALGYTWYLSRSLTIIISTTVAALLALESVLRYRDLWRNYRMTEQYLHAQRYLFEYRVGEFETLDDEAAAKRLIANVESAIKTENEVTLNALARTDSGSGTEKSGKG